MDLPLARYFLSFRAASSASGLLQHTVPTALPLTQSSARLGSRQAQMCEDCLQGGMVHKICAPRGAGQNLSVLALCLHAKSSQVARLYMQDIVCVGYERAITA